MHKSIAFSIWQNLITSFKLRCAKKDVVSKTKVIAETDSEHSLLK